MKVRPRFSEWAVQVATRPEGAYALLTQLPTPPRRSDRSGKRCLDAVRNERAVFPLLSVLQVASLLREPAPIIADLRDQGAAPR